MQENFYLMSGLEYNELAKWQESIFSRPLEEGVYFKENIFPDSGIGVIPIEGPLFHRRTKLMDLTGGSVYGEISDQVIKLMQHPCVETIVLKFDSPGGTVTGCGECADVIFHARKVKPVVAIVQGNCASGAYWLASACKRILLSGKTCDVGSVGIKYKRGQETDAEVSICSGELKDVYAGKRTPTKDAYIDRMAVSALKTFIDSVQAYRGLSHQQVMDLSSGETFIGGDAIKAGLADGYYSPFIWHLSKRIEEIKMMEV